VEYKILCLQDQLDLPDQQATLVQLVILATQEQPVKPVQQDHQQQDQLVLLVLQQILAQLDQLVRWEQDQQVLLVLQQILVQLDQLALLDQLVLPDRRL
jgi:hypothetical protein